MAQIMVTCLLASALIQVSFCAGAGPAYDGRMNRYLLLLFVTGALLGMMALMPEGDSRNKKAIIYDDAVERNPASIPHDKLSVIQPASGEPSDNGLTQNLHREFRETLNRDPVAAVVLAKEYVFTNELDNEFRLEILRDLKEIQFTEPAVFDLAGEIIAKNPDVRLVEEALHIKSAILSEEEFGLMLTEISEKSSSPEILDLIKRF